MISEKEYNEYIDWIDRHIFRAELTDDELEMLDRLTTLIEEYECVHYPTIFDEDGHIIGIGDEAP